MSDLPHVPPVRARVILQIEGQAPIVFAEDLVEMQVHAIADTPAVVRAKMPADAEFFAGINARSVRDLFLAALDEIDAGIAHDPTPKENQ